MLDELTEYFKLATRYRTASPEIRGAIVRIAFPKLWQKTSSQRLRVAIDKFVAQAEPDKKVG